MESHGGCPGVEHAEQSNGSTHIVGIGRQFHEGEGSCSDQDTVEGFLMCTDHGVEFSGEGEDEVEIARGHQFGSTFVKPSLCVGSMTGGTAAVAAGMVDVLPIAAPGALRDVASQGLGPAPGDIRECTSVAGEDGSVELTDILGSVPTDDLR